MLPFLGIRGIRPLGVFMTSYPAVNNLGIGICRIRMLSQTSIRSSSPNIKDGSQHPILKRIPKFMWPYAERFAQAPLSHVTAFAILHELTAMVPLIGIWYFLFKFQIIPTLDTPEWAIEKGKEVIEKSTKNFNFEGYSVEEKARFIMDGVYSYIIVKGLFPLRVLVSFLAMPFVAKYFVVPFTAVLQKFRGRKPKQNNPEKESFPQNSQDVQQKKVEKPRL